MRKKLILLTLAMTFALLSGCATYKDQPWTPDGFNYTVSRDHRSGELVDYFGLSWNLKP